jgi:hypothetical protein
LRYAKSGNRPNFSPAFVYYTSCQESGLISNSNVDCIKTNVMGWVLQSAPLICAVLVLVRNKPPIFFLIIENVVSTFERYHQRSKNFSLFKA